jgi:osmotically inducible protein OsmC
MKTRTAEATWTGDLREGRGNMRLGSGTWEGDYSFGTRMGDQPGTNPEELIGAALAGCFSMALSNALAEAGHTPTRVHTTARVAFGQVDGGFSIPRIDLELEAEVPGIDESEFQRLAEEAKSGCPVSKALAATEIELNGRLVSGEGRAAAD